MVDLDLPVLAGSSVRGYIYKQSHANTKVWFKRYMLLYKGLLFYWENQSQYEKNFPTILAALANTTLPVFHNLFLYFNDPDSLEFSKKGEITPKRANKILTSETHFRGLYFVYGHDVKKGFDAIKISSGNNKVKTLNVVPADSLPSSYPLMSNQSSVDGDNLRFSAVYPHPEALLSIGTPDTPHHPPPSQSTSSITTAQHGKSSSGNDLYLHPLSITVIHKDMFRTLDLGFTTDYCRDLWFSSFQSISSQLVAPKVLPLLRGLQLPSGIRFGDLRLDEITIFLASNQYTQFDVNEHVLLYYYTGSSQSNPPTDAFTRCVLFTTHRIIKIHGNEVPINYSYSEISNVLFYAKGQDSRRKAGLVNTVRLVCNTNSISNVKDRNLLMSTLKGIKYVMNATASAVVGTGRSHQQQPQQSQQQQQQQSQQSKQQKTSNSNTQQMPAITRMSTRHTHQELGLSYWYIDQATLPEIKTMDPRAHILLHLTIGRIIPLIVTGNTKYDSFFANLLSRIVVVRQLFAMNKERYAIGVYNNRLRLWDWSVHRYIALLRTITSDGRALSQYSRQRQLERKKSFSTNTDRDKERYQAQKDALSSYVNDGILIQQRMAGEYSSQADIPPPRLLPHLVSGYIDFSGGAIKLSQNLINIAYYNILNEYYHNGELNVDPLDTIEMNRKIQAIQTLQEFYREDVNYITAGDSGLVVLDIKPIGSIFHDQQHDIQSDTKHKKVKHNIQQTYANVKPSSDGGLFQIDEFNAAPILDATPLYLPPNTSLLQADNPPPPSSLQPSTGAKGKKSSSPPHVRFTRQGSLPGGDGRDQVAKKRTKRSLYFESSEDDSSDGHGNGNNVPITSTDAADEGIIELDPSLSLTNGNGTKQGKYNRAYQYEFVLSEFTGHKTQQWKWNESDLLWPYHSTIVPSYFNEMVASDAKSNDETSTDNILASKYKVGDIYTEEVWQNQRYYPFFRWSENLLPTDRPSWSTDTGLARTVVEANRDLPEGWEWIDPQWSKDVTSTQSSEGWWYGSEFKPGLEGYSAVCNSLVHVTRKRKWIRRRRCVRVVTPSESTDKLPLHFGGNDTSFTNKLDSDRHSSDDDDDDDDDEDDDDDDDNDAYGAKVKDKFSKPIGKEIAERNILRKQSLNGPGVYVEYIYENQKYVALKGWVNEMIPITQSTNISSSSSSKKAPTKGHWSSEDRQYVVVDKNDIQPGQGYRWCSQWELDVFVDGDEEHWMYTRSLENSITGKWLNNNHIGTSYRRRRWCRYKELILRNIYLPAPYSYMMIRYEENDTISFTDSSNANDGNRDAALSTPSGDAQPPKSLLTIKSMFDIHDLAHESLRTVLPGSLVSLERLQTKHGGSKPDGDDAIDHHDENNYNDESDDDDDDDDDDEDGAHVHKESVYQRWNILGLDSLYLERVILPFIHLADISKEELKVAHSVMEVYHTSTQPVSGTTSSSSSSSTTTTTTSNSASTTTTTSSTSSSSSSNTSMSRRSSVTGYEDTDNSFVKLAKTYGIETINDLVYTHDYLTYKASEGISDISQYHPHRHYLSSTFTAINIPLAPKRQSVVPRQPGRTMSDDDDDDGDGDGDERYATDDMDASQLSSNTTIARNFNYLDHLTRAVSSIPSGHLSAYLQLWLEQSRAACLFHNVSWVNRVPPPLLFHAFHKFMPDSLIKPPKTLPPLPFISSYCYQHNLVWSNDYFSVYSPRLVDTRPTTGLGDVEASENQFISFGDCVVNNGSEVRSTVYIDHPLLLPPISFRLVHVLTDDQTIMSTGGGAGMIGANGPIQGILNASQPLLIYEMIPPVGYVALGLIARTGRPTNTHYYRCIPQDFVSIPSPHPSLKVSDAEQTNDVESRTVYPTPPTPIRLFSNADGYTRSIRIGHVVSGFERTAELLTDTILNDDSLFEVTQRVKDLHKLPSNGGDSTSSKSTTDAASRKQALHPWSTHDIRSEGVSVVDEAIANGVLAEALRDLAQFDHNERRTDQRSILQKVIDAVNKRRGEEAKSSQIANNALEKHTDRPQKRGGDDGEDNSEEYDDDDDVDFSVIIPPTIITNVDEKHKKMLGVNEPSHLISLSKSRHRKEWRRITKQNTQNNYSITIKPKHNEVSQHALYYKQKKTTPSQQSIRFPSPDDTAVVTSVRVKTLEEEEVDHIPFGETKGALSAMDNLGNAKLAEDLTGEFMKLSKTMKPSGDIDSTTAVALVNDSSPNSQQRTISPLTKVDANKIQAFGIPQSRIKVIQRRLRKYSSLTRDQLQSRRQRSLSLPRTPSSVNDPQSGLFGTIFEKKIAHVTFPTITLPYFHSNSDLLQPKLRYVHNNVDAILSRFKDDDDEMAIVLPDQASSSNRLLPFNSVISKLPTPTGSLALWTLPSGTFTVTAGQGSPTNIRLGMGNVKPMASWCAELFMHAHTIEILLLGVINKRVLYKNRWDAYQQKLMQEEEERAQQEKTRLQRLRQKFKKGSSSASSSSAALSSSTTLDIGVAGVAGASQVGSTTKLGNRLYDDTIDGENDDDGTVHVRDINQASDDESADDFYDPLADPDEQARREEQQKRVKMEQEKNKKFYDSDDDTINATPARSSKDDSSDDYHDDDDDDRFNFIGDDIGLRKKFIFSEEVDGFVDLGATSGEKTDLIEMSSSLFETDNAAEGFARKPKGKDNRPSDGKPTTTGADPTPPQSSDSTDGATGFGQKQIIHDQYGNVITTITSYGNNIVIPGVNDDLMNALPTDDTPDHDDSAPKPGDGDQDKPECDPPFKYEYLSPKKVRQLLPPMISLVKHYALWIRQIAQHFNIVNNHEYSLPIPCQTCVLDEYKRLQGQIKGTPTPQQLNALKPFEEYDMIKHYFKYGVVIGNACINITPHNFDAIGITNICSLIDNELLVLCKCPKPSADHTLGSATPGSPTLPSSFSSKTPTVISPPPNALKAKRSLYGNADVFHPSTASSELPSQQQPTFTKGHYFDFTPYLTTLASAPPFLCPMTPSEHLACLLWLMSQTNRLCQSIRVSIIEDLLHVALHSKGDKKQSSSSSTASSSSAAVPPAKVSPSVASTDQIGSLLSLLIRWESVLDFIPPLTSTDNAVCNQLLRKSNCSVPKRDDLILNQPFKTYVYSRCLDLVTTRFVNMISPSLSAWDRVRNTITGVGLPPAGSTNPNHSASVATLTGTQSSGRSLYSHLNKHEGDTEDDTMYSSVLPSTNPGHDANRHGVTVSDADLAAEFAVDLNLTLVDTNTNEKNNSATGNQDHETNKQQIMQQLLMTMTSLSQDLLAVHRTGKRRLGIFKLFLFTYNDLFLQIFNYSLHVDALVLAEKASVGEWLDYYNSLLKSITRFITHDNNNMLQFPQSSAYTMNQRYVLNRYQEFRSLRLVCLDLLHNIRTMRLTYVTEYLNVVKTNINYMFENILMSETSLLPVYQPYNSMIGLEHGQFETHSPTDVYEILHTFCNTMIKQFRLYPIFNQFIGITPTPSTPIMSLLHPPPDAPITHHRRPMIPFSLRELIIEFGLLHIVMNNQPIDYEILQDKYLLVSKLFDVLLQAQSYYFSALLLHLDRIYQRVVANKGGIYDGFKPKELQQTTTERKFFARRSGKQPDPQSTDGKTPEAEQRQQQIVSILDIPSAMRIFNSAVADMQKYVEENKINVKRKQSFGQKLSLQYIFSNSVSSSTASHRIASVITNTSTVSSIPLPHIYITGHMNNIWDYLNHRQGLVERFQNLSDEIDMTQPQAQRILSFVKRSALMICARGSNVSGDFASTMDSLDDDSDSETDLWGDDSSYDESGDDNSNPQQKSVVLDLNQLPSDDFIKKVSDTTKGGGSGGGDTRQSTIKQAIMKRQRLNNELLKDYSNFNTFFAALLEREGDLVENNIYNLYHKCQDILIAQCCFTSALTHTVKLHSNEWWTSSGMINDWLETHFIFLYNTFIGLQVHSLNVRFVKQYLRKWVKNICYLYLSRFLAAFHWDKRRPEYITHLLKQTKTNDYNFNILLDKLYSDLQAIVSFCRTLETRLPPHIASKYEEDLSMRDVFKTDTILLSQFLRIAEFDNPYDRIPTGDEPVTGGGKGSKPQDTCMAIITQFDDIHTSISGTKYLAEDVVKQIFEGAESSSTSSLTTVATMGGLIPIAGSSSNFPVYVTMYNLVQVIYSLRFGTHNSQNKSNLQNLLGQITQLTNNITQKKLSTAASSSSSKMTGSPGPMSRQLSLHGGPDSGDHGGDDDEDEYESILKHNSLRLSVLVENGRGLIAKNTDGVSSDPYVVVKLIQGRIGGSEGNKVMEKKKTSAITANINPDWYEVVSFSPKNLLFTDSIELSIFDSNWLSRDQSMGTVRISRHSIEQRCIQQRKNKNQRRNSLDQEQMKRDEIIANIAKANTVASPTNSGIKTKSAVWGHCTERFALTIPNRGTLTCTFILIEEKK